MNADLHRPRKRFGQHFLHDQMVIERIIQSIDPQPNDIIIEIGPGKGALTAHLMENLIALSAIELDRDLIEQLSLEFPALNIYQQDVLKFDFSRLKSSCIRVVGNLPYNISTELLFHLLKYRESISDMVFMLQKEVADRLCATHSTSSYGRLSVMCQTYYEINHLFNVKPDAFNPPPKVDSSVIKLVPIKDPAYQLSDETGYAKVVKQAFSQRRKTIRNTLRSLFNDSDFYNISIAPDKRAENLTVEDYVKLANYYVINRNQ